MKLKNNEIIYFYDTSALLGGARINENCFISPTVCNELESIKTNATKTEEIKYKARSLVRKLITANNFKTRVFNEKDIQKMFKKYPFLAAKADSRIICEALLLNKTNSVIFVTQDACQYLIIRERFPELKVEYYEEERDKENLWKGYVSLEPTEEELDSIYCNPERNILNLNINEYAIINNKGKIGDIIKWNGETYSTLNYKPISSEYFGKINPRNIQQKMYFDLLQDRTTPVKLCRGNFGTGKTYLALVHAMNLIQFHKFDKIVFVRNNIEVAGSQKLGALPGTEVEKLMPYLMPLADHLGDVSVLEQYIEEGVIEPIHVGFLRGRSFSNSIILVDEGENLTNNIMKLIVGRVGENSELWILGDEAQADLDIFKKNSGIASMINSLKGNKMFGTVELHKPERSAVAQLCDLIK